MKLRHGTDADDYIGLIGACWAEYPGVILDVDGENPELRHLASHYERKGGAVWVAEVGTGIVGMIAIAPGKDGTWEIGRLYALAKHRGGGLSQGLLAIAEADARRAGARRLTLWTDTRFKRAHRFYEKASFVRASEARQLGDISDSIEFQYAKPLDGTLALSGAGATSGVRRLADILVACVDGGASVSYIPPLDHAVATHFWERMATEVGSGRRVLIGGWSDGVLAGTVMLEHATSPNAPHRTEVQKLLVHPTARRRGLARMLMAHAEQEAARAHRTLLTLDTRSGGEAEGLYRSLGWTEVGRIPGFALSPEGTLDGTTIFWKSLE